MCVGEGGAGGSVEASRFSKTGACSFRRAAGSGGKGFDLGSQKVRHFHSNNAYRKAGDSVTEAGEGGGVVLSTRSPDCSTPGDCSPFGGATKSGISTTIMCKKAGDYIAGAGEGA